jgi:hypothetical protein
VTLLAGTVLVPPAARADSVKIEKTDPPLSFHFRRRAQPVPIDVTVSSEVESPDGGRVVFRVYDHRGQALTTPMTPAQVKGGRDTVIFRAMVRTLDIGVGGSWSKPSSWPRTRTGRARAIRGAPGSRTASIEAERRSRVHRITPPRWRNSGGVGAVIPLEVLELEPMASGHRSLRLTREVTWEDFDGYAEVLLDVLDGMVLERADSPVERVWRVRITGAEYWLCLDDFGLGVSLDARDAVADARMETIRARLLIHTRTLP